MREHALQGVVRIPQAVAFLPTFSGVKMCPRRAGRVGNCFAPAIPVLVPPRSFPSDPPTISLAASTLSDMAEKALALSRFPHFFSPPSSIFPCPLSLSGYLGIPSLSFRRGGLTCCSMTAVGGNEKRARAYGSVRFACPRVLFSLSSRCL